MKKLQVEIDGRIVEVLAQKVAGKLWIHHQGETFDYSPESQLQGVSGGAGATDPSQVVAPMPGKIIKILKQVGDEVAEGDTIVVMEAMKMEYNLKSAAAMKISKINCKENQTVSLAALLVEMEEL